MRGLTLSSFSMLFLFMAMGAGCQSRRPTGPPVVADGGTSDDGGTPDAYMADSGMPMMDPDTGMAACTNDTWADWPRTFFSDHCTRCHGSQLSSLSVVRANEGVISSDISSGRMPRDERLSSADKDRILTWLSCGAP